MDKRKEVLIQSLQDAEAEIRNTAAEALERLQIRDRIDALAQKMDNGEMLEKIRLIYAIGDLRGEKVISVLSKAFKDPHEDVRAACARALGNMADNRVLPALVEALKDPSPIVVRTVVDSVMKYSDQRLLGPLMHVLKNPDQGAVEKAIEAVGRTGDKRAEEAMVYFAVKGNKKMRGLAIKALGEMDR